jgi:betaine-homocysteine S-methyltransferase
MSANILTNRLDQGPVLCAEGFLFELERRGYLTAGKFVPEVAREDADALETLHSNFQRAGSDIVEAFTYNIGRTQREPMVSPDRIGDDFTRMTKALQERP